MSEELHLYAASEAEVAAAFGLGLRAPDAAAALHARMVECSLDDLAYDMPGVEVAGWSLLRHPEQGYPATEDCYWRALEALVAVNSWADLAVPGLAVARDLDDAFTRAGVPAERLPRALSRRPAVALPPPEDFDVRVIEHARAVDLLQTWLLAEATELPELTGFARDVATLGARVPAHHRAPVDLWLFSPGHTPAVPRREPEIWPPRPVEPRPRGPHFDALVRRFGNGDTVT